MPDSRGFCGASPWAVSCAADAESSCQLSLAMSSSAIAVAQLQGRIGQQVAQAELRQRRPDPAHHDAGVLVASSEDEASDHDVVARLDKAARADVGQL